MTPEERREERRRKDPMIHRFERELRERLDLPEADFHRVRHDRWRTVLAGLADRFADRTRDRKRDLHWANTNGYSPWAMERLAGCWHTDYRTWFFCLPELLPEDGFVYLLLEPAGGRFWLFEGRLDAVIRALALLNDTAFLGLGSPDYYLASRKYRWIIGFNHHDVVSLAGEGFCLEGFGGFPPPR